MKFITIALLLQISTICFGQKPKSYFELYFGNSFRNDTLSIFINDSPILKNEVLNPVMYDPLNLVLIQYKRNLTVSRYPDSTQKIKVSPTNKQVLKIDIELNGTRYNFLFNLKEGRYFFVKNISEKTEAIVTKKLTIKQKSTGPIVL